MNKTLAAKIAGVPANRLQVSFRDFGCVLHRSHHPTPNRVELHHRFALYLQAKVWADVEPSRPGTAHDKERIPVCEGGHSDVHQAAAALLAGETMPKGVGRAERAEANEMLRRYAAATG
jgi:hypothetical protein